MICHPWPTDSRYLVSRGGVIIGPKGYPLNWQVRRSTPTSEPYATVSAGGRTKLVHQMVLETYNGPRPYKLMGCHKNGRSLDNRDENLYWGTAKQNVADRLRHRGHHFGDLTHCKRNHEFTRENTKITSIGSRQCLACEKITRAERRTDFVLSCTERKAILTGQMAVPA